MALIINFQNLQQENGKEMEMKMVQPLNLKQRLLLLG